MERKYIYCNTCKEHHWTDELCTPVYIVFHEEEPHEVRAHTFESAAVKYAERYNDEGDLMNDDIEIEVEKDGIKKKFNVGAEPDIYYSYNEIE